MVSGKVVPLSGSLQPSSLHGTIASLVTCFFFITATVDVVMLHADACMPPLARNSAAQDLLSFIYF